MYLNCDNIINILLVILETHVFLVKVVDISEARQALLPEFLLASLLAQRVFFLLRKNDVQS